MHLMHVNWDVMSLHLQMISPFYRFWEHLQELQVFLVKIGMKRDSCEISCQFDIAQAEPDFLS